MMIAGQFPAEIRSAKEREGLKRANPFRNGGRAVRLAEKAREDEDGVSDPIL